MFLINTTSGSLLLLITEARFNPKLIGTRKKIGRDLKAAYCTATTKSGDSFICSLSF